MKARKAEAFTRGRAKPEDFVFATASGRAWNQRNASRALADAAEKAGIEGLTTHALRHGFVSWLIREGFDPVRVARQVGHTSAAFTLTVYAQEFEEAAHGEELRKRLAASEFGQVLGSS